MHLYVCIYSIYIYIYIYININMYTILFVYIFACLSAIYIYIYVYIYVCVCTKSLVPKHDKLHLKKINEFPPKSVFYLVGIEKSIFNFTPVSLLCRM